MSLARVAALLFIGSASCGGDGDGFIRGTFDIEGEQVSFARKLEVEAREGMLLADRGPRTGGVDLALVLGQPAALETGTYEVGSRRVAVSFFFQADEVESYQGPGTSGAMLIEALPFDDARTLRGTLRDVRTTALEQPLGRVAIREASFEVRFSEYALALAAP